MNRSKKSNGLIVQRLNYTWASTANGVYQNISFAVSFSNTNYAIIAQSLGDMYTTSQPYNLVATIAEKTTSSFYIGIRGPTNATEKSVGLDVIMRGYWFNL